MFLIRWILIFEDRPRENTKDIILGEYWSSFAMNVASKSTVVILLNSSFICKKYGTNKKAQFVNVENWM